MVFHIRYQAVFKKGEKLFMKIFLMILYAYVLFVIGTDFIYLMRENPPLGFHVYAYTINTIFFTYIFYILWRQNA